MESGSDWSELVGQIAHIDHVTRFLQLVARFCKRSSFEIAVKFSLGPHETSYTLDEPYGRVVQSKVKESQDRKYVQGRSINELAS